MAILTDRGRIIDISCSVHESEWHSISIYVRQKYKSNCTIEVDFYRSNRNSIDFNEKEGVPPPAVLLCETAGLIDINELN